MWATTIMVVAFFFQIDLGRWGHEPIFNKILNDI
jgi:hypothetical protein